LVSPVFSSGPTWIHGGDRSPLLDRVAAALLILGVALVGLGAVAGRRLGNLALLLSVPLLMLPAILAPLPPEMAPSPTYCGGAMAPVFVLAGIGLAAVFTAVKATLAAPAGGRLALIVVVVLVGLSAAAGRTTVATFFAESWDPHTWNTSELGEVVRGSMALGVAADRAEVVAYPHWVDSRLVAITAGHPSLDLALNPSSVETAARRPGPKLFLVHPDDHKTLRTLAAALPGSNPIRIESRVPGKSFLMVLDLSSADGS
jgi:hypothetical protein